MRHSPSRGPAPPVHQEDNYYDDNLDEVYEGDELIDDAANRYSNYNTDYNPGQKQSYPPVSTSQKQVYNRDYGYQRQDSYQGTDMSKDAEMV